jgi:hypothetical protein
VTNLFTQQKKNVVSNQTDKKNQHFVPRFYLKNFSVSNEKKQIHLFNQRNQKFVTVASIANQCSRDYFYGKDGVIEDSLSVIEGEQASTIRKIIRTGEPPKNGSNGFSDLIFFVILTEKRNPIAAEMMRQTNENFANLMSRHESIEGKYSAEYIRESMGSPIARSLSMVSDGVDVCADLHVKLLLNETPIPFITSDCPVVLYNQFFEHNEGKVPYGAGFGTVGSQIFLPINDKICLMFYDSKIYYAGKKKGKVIKIDNPKDITQINLLQMVNCHANIYGNELFTEDYAKQLQELSKKFEKPHVVTRSEYPTGQPNSAVMLQTVTSCKTNMILSFMSLSTAGSTFKFSGFITYARPIVERVREEWKNEQEKERIRKDSEIREYMKRFAAAQTPKQNKSNQNG